MLSVDQFLRLIWVPALVIASQVSAAFGTRPALVEMARR
jgi:hypothetical protein